MAKTTTYAIWDWGLHTDKIWWNEGMRRLFGFPPEELEPKSDSWTSRIHPDDSEAVQGVA